MSILIRGKKKKTVRSTDPFAQLKTWITWLLQNLTTKPTVEQSLMANINSRLTYILYVYYVMCSSNREQKLLRKSWEKYIYCIYWYCLQDKSCQYLHQYCLIWYKSLFMLYVSLMLDIKDEKMWKRNSYLLTGVTIHSLITKKQQYNCFMVT